MDINKCGAFTVSHLYNQKINKTINVFSNAHFVSSDFIRSLWTELLKQYRNREQHY